MQVLSVGGKIHPSMPSEGIALEIMPANLHLCIRMDAPTRDELMSFKKGIKSVGIFIYEEGFPVPFLLLSFKGKGLPIMDCPYNVHISDSTNEEVRSIVTNFINSEGNALHYFLVDGQVIRAMRVFGMPDPIMSLFRSAVKAQRSIPLSMPDYDKLLSRVYSKYTTEDMFKMAQYVHIV